MPKGVFMATQQLILRRRAAQPLSHSARQFAALKSAVVNLQDSTRYFEDEGCDRLDEALKFAAFAHQGQTRKSGEPFVIHPIETAQILAEMRLDSDTVIAGLLHDTIEDTDVTLEQIKHRFGLQVATIVAGVTDKEHRRKSENKRNFFLAMATEWRVGLVKLADRLHNMRTLDYMPRQKQVRKSEETMAFFVPLAKTLGLSQMENELTQLCSTHLHPLGKPLATVPGAARHLHAFAERRCPSRLDDFLNDDEALHAVPKLLLDYRETWLNHVSHHNLKW